MTCTNRLPINAYAAQAMLNEQRMFSVEDRALASDEQDKLARKRAVQAAHVYASEFQIDIDELRDALRTAVVL